MAAVSAREVGNGVAIELAVKAASRAAASQGIRMRRGMRGLDAVATTGPLFGAFGSGIGIIESFGPMNGNKDSILGRLLWNLSDSLTPMLLGIAVALTAWWIERYLRRRSEEFDRETALACHDVMTYCLVSSGLRDFSKNSF